MRPIEKQIIDLVCKEYSITEKQLFTKQRFATPKYMVIYFLYNLGYKTCEIKKVLKISSTDYVTFIVYKINTIFIFRDEFIEVVNRLEKQLPKHNTNIYFRKFVLENNHLAGKYIANLYDKKLKQVQCVIAYNNLKLKTIFKQ